VSADSRENCVELDGPFAEPLDGARRATNDIRVRNKVLVTDKVGYLILTLCIHTKERL